MSGIHNFYICKKFINIWIIKKNEKLKRKEIELKNKEQVCN